MIGMVLASNTPIGTNDGNGMKSISKFAFIAAIALVVIVNLGRAGFGVMRRRRTA